MPLDRTAAVQRAAQDAANALPDDLDKRPGEAVQLTGADREQVTAADPQAIA